MWRLKTVENSVIVLCKDTNLSINKLILLKKILLKIKSTVKSTVNLSKSCGFLARFIVSSIQQGRLKIYVADFGGKRGIGCQEL